MDVLIAMAWLTLMILVIFLLGVAAAVVALLRDYQMWQANIFRGIVVVTCYSCVALRAFFVANGWPIGLIFATAAGIEAYWIWEEWKKNKPKRRKESATEKVVRLIAGKLKVVAPS